MICFAQNQEDVLLHRVFGGQETGFYVDVGAYHPVNGSVTKALYERGWSGINIEPGEVFAELAASRTRDVNLRMAVLDRTGEVAFLQEPADAGMSHVLAPEHAAENATSNAPMVPCDTLENIVSKYGRSRPVDFIKIDAEGSELAIVQSTNWRNLRPRVLLIEATLPWSSTLSNQQWEPILLEHGYERVYFDGINCFYIPAELGAALGHHFATPVNVLDRAIAYDPRLELLQAAHDQLIAKIASSDGERQRLSESLLAAEHDRDALRMDLQAAGKERERLAVTLEALRADLREMWSDHQTIRADRDRLTAACASSAAECAELRASIGALRADTARLSAELAIERVRVAPTIVTVSAPAPPQSAARPLSRRVARFGYRLVRPVVRPIIWRLRNFFTEPLSIQIRHVSDRLETVHGGIGELHGAVRAVPPIAPPVAQPADTAGLVEMRNLAQVIEQAILSLAVAAPQSPNSSRWRKRFDEPAQQTASTS